MKVVLLTLCLAVLPHHAQAINRYSSTSLNCDEVKSTLQEEGASIMQYRSPSSPGIQLYDRYVSSKQFCQSSQEVRTTYIPSAGGSCAVLRCVDCELEDVRR